MCSNKHHVITIHWLLLLVEPPFKFFMPRSRQTYLMCTFLSCSRTFLLCSRNLLCTHILFIVAASTWYIKKPPSLLPWSSSLQCTQFPYTLSFLTTCGFWLESLSHHLYTRVVWSLTLTKTNYSYIYNNNKIWKSKQRKYN